MHFERAVYCFLVSRHPAFNSECYFPLFTISTLRLKAFQLILWTQFYLRPWRIYAVFSSLFRALIVWKAALPFNVVYLKRNFWNDIIVNSVLSISLNKTALPSIQKRCELLIFCINNWLIIHMNKQTANEYAENLWHFIHYVSDFISVCRSDGNNLSRARNTTQNNKCPLAVQLLIANRRREIRITNLFYLMR